MAPAGEGGSTGGGVGPDVEGPQVGADGKIADTPQIADTQLLNGSVSQLPAAEVSAVTADVATAADTVTAKEIQPGEPVAETVVEAPVAPEETVVADTTVKTPEVAETIGETSKVTEAVVEASVVAETVVEPPVVAEIVAETPKMVETPVEAEKKMRHQRRLKELLKHQ